MKTLLCARSLRIVRRSGDLAFELSVDDLEIHGGQVLAVLGPNGAGKSTLLRALAGLELPQSGRIERIGAGGVTMVFQRPIALAGSVDHNVRIALRAQGLPGDEIELRCRRALAHFGINDLAERPANGLSGGELRRLALARAFALEPSVLLLDEPFDDLDSLAQEALSRDLRRAVGETGVAVAVVTHDLRRAVLVCDRIAVLFSGALRQCGERDEVLNRPASLEIARLVGMTNLIAADLDARGIARVDSKLSIPSHVRERPGRVHIGLRPEHLKVEVGRGEGMPIGTAEVLERTSDGVLATLSLRWGQEILRTHLVAGRGLARELKPGDRVSLSVRPEDVHVMRD